MSYWDDDLKVAEGSRAKSVSDAEMEFLTEHEPILWNPGNSRGPEELCSNVTVGEARQGNVLAGVGEFTRSRDHAE